MCESNLNKKLLHFSGFLDDVTFTSLPERIVQNGGDVKLICGWGRNRNKKTVSWLRKKRNTEQELYRLTTDNRDFWKYSVASIDLPLKVNEAKVQVAASQASIIIRDVLYGDEGPYYCNVTVHGKEKSLPTKTSKSKAEFVIRSKLYC